MSDEERHFPKTMYNNLNKYFDPYEFNLKFDQYIHETEKQSLLYDKVNLQSINKIEQTKVEPYQESIGDIVVGIKNVWYLMFDNLFSGKFIFNTMNNNDIFYLAISLISFALIYISLAFIFN